MRALQLGEIATRHPEAIDVFERYHLDFCCGGDQTLDEACATAGLDPATVAQAIEDAAPPGDAWAGGTPAELIEHLLFVYHRPLDSDLPRIAKLAEKVANRHGPTHPFLVELAGAYRALHDDLVQHMAKEEQILFPMITAGQGAMADGPIEVMRHEHDDAGALLARMRALTDDYRAPEHACDSWRALYASLGQLEVALHKHIHLENNVLFPMVLED